MNRDEFLNQASKESLIELVKAQDKQLGGALKGLENLKKDYSLSAWTTEVINRAISILKGGKE